MFTKWVPLVIVIAASSALAEGRSVDNQTRSLELLSLTEANDIVHVTLKNTSDKPIMTLAVGIGSMRLVRNINFFTGGLTPGATITLDVGDPRVTYAKGEVAPANAKDFRILAAIFADKTTDGDPRELRDMLDDRTGTKQQYERLLALIENLELQVGVNPRAMLDGLISRVPKLPHSSGPGTAQHVQRGAQALRSQLTQRLERLKSEADQRPDDYLRTHLAELKEECRRFIEML